MRTTTRIAAGLLAALAAGCSGHSTPPPAPPPAASTAAPATSRTATVEHYAVGVREFADDIRRSADNLDLCTTPDDCAFYVTSARGYVGLFGEQMKLLAAPVGQGGAPPPQIAALVAKTIQAIKVAIAAGDRFQQGDTDVAPVRAAEDALVGVLGEWGPYGV